jgi:hypothetical protein
MDESINSALKATRLVKDADGTYRSVPELKSDDVPGGHKFLNEA